MTTENPYPGTVSIIPGPANPPTDPQITPEDLEVARKAARDAKGLIRIYEVALLFTEITARISSRRREIEALDLEAGEKRKKLEEVAAEILAIRSRITEEGKALETLKARVAREQQTAEQAIINLAENLARDLAGATKNHDATLRRLDTEQADRLTAQNLEFAEQKARLEEELAALRAEIQAAEREAEALAGRIAGRRRL